MSDRNLPGPEHVPDNVLQELHGAFSDPTPTYDFDDPALDRLLGLEPDHTEGAIDHDLQPRFADETAGGSIIPPPVANEDDEDVTGELPATADADADADPDFTDGLPTAEVEIVEPEARRTIVIGGDELPDVVYLDEQKEHEYYERREEVAGTSSRSTIVIDDLDEGRVIDVSEARVSSGIDPRMSARRKAVRKEQGRKRLMWFGIAFGVFVAIVLVIALFASTLFDVRNVNVQGVVYSDPAAVEAITSELVGKPVLLVDTQAAERKLEALPWVERAVVSTDFPHGLYVDIREREAVATFQSSDGKFRVIDITGRVLQLSDGQPADLMLINGNNPNTAPGAWTPTSYRDAAILVMALPDEIRQVTSYVGVDPATGSLTIALNSNVIVRLGDASDLENKLARLLSRVRLGLEGICELDVATAEVGAVACNT
ncbi:MAG TPA: FtsQ-type POTRA domain-containing protein [Ilumatobacteraceae bacterium]|nr:FtsQ-type POTRA domain-containing protein [Ilumatobacteraceae bacterium]